MCWSFFEEYLAVITFKLVLEPNFKKQNVWSFLDEYLANTALQLSTVPLLGLSRAHPIFWSCLEAYLTAIAFEVLLKQIYLYFSCKMFGHF